VTAPTKIWTDSDVRILNERVCLRVGDGYSLSEQTISELLECISSLQEQRDNALAAISDEVRNHEERSSQ
jgi:hypothetical protein